MKIVTEEKINIALAVLDALKDELKTHPELQIDWVPNHRARHERVTALDLVLDMNLSSIVSLKLELKYCVKHRRQGSHSTPPPNLTLNALTTPELRTAVDVLTMLSKLIKINPGDAIMELLDAWTDNQHAGQIDALSMEPICRIQTVTKQLTHWRDQIR
jgi:hypothetical protein